jgi:hypothetical protein
VTGDILLFYYGNKLTEFHGHWRRKKLGRATIVPYHSAIVATNLPEEGRCFILDPEVTTSFSLLKEYTKKSSQRIDVIHPMAMREDLDKVATKIDELGTNEGLYDVGGYGAFISQMPLLNWVKYIIRPSKKKFFCSDAASFVWEDTTLRVSPRGHDYTAPVDLLLYAMKHPELLQLRTLKIRGVRI